MTKSLTKNTQYSTLIADLKKILEEGLKFGEDLGKPPGEILPDLVRKCARRAHWGRFSIRNYWIKN